MPFVCAAKSGVRLDLPMSSAPPMTAAAVAPPLDMTVNWTSIPARL